MRLCGNYWQIFLFEKYYIRFARIIFNKEKKRLKQFKINLKKMQIQWKYKNKIFYNFLNVYLICKCIPKCIIAFDYNLDFAIQQKSFI